jgi:integrase
MPKLTKRTVDAAIATGQEYFLWDADLPGFGLRVLLSGRKSYVVQYRTGGRGGPTRRKALGLHGVLTAEEARTEARKWLAERAKGNDPIGEHIANQKAETVTELCSRYLSAAKQGLILGKGARPKKTSTVSTDRGRIERHIIPHLGRKRVKEVTTADVHRFMRDVMAGKTATDVKTGFRGRAIVEGGPGTAARTVGLLGGIFTYAVSEGLRADNPVRGVRRPADRKRDRRLSTSEYKALGEALAEAATQMEQPAAIAAIRLLALTGARFSEILNLRCAEVDRVAYALRLGNTKEGASVRPIGSVALSVIEEQTLKLGESKSPYILPGQMENRPYGGLPKALKRIIARRPQLAGVTAQTLRHSFASVADELGYTEATVAALLGHRSGTITRRYIHHLDSALIAAADRVSAHIQAMMSK